MASQFLSRVVRLVRNPHATRLIFAHFLRITGLCNLIVFRVHGFNLRFCATNVSAILWSDPDFCNHDLEVFEKLLSQGDVVIDVGANIGHLSLAAAQIVGSTGKVIAIEAHPRTFGFLTRNIAVNPDLSVETHNVALGADTGEITFTSKRADDQNHVQMDGIGTRVPLRRLDDLVSISGPVTLLKIDVEGYELPVLQGATEILARTKFLYFEAAEQFFSKFGYRTGDVISILQKSGFTICKFGDENVLHAVDSDFVSSDCINMIAFRDERELSARTGLRILYAKNRESA